MVTAAQFKRGVDVYFTSEVFPKIPEAKKFLAAFGVALMAEGIEHNEMIRTLGLVSEEGMLDIERAYAAAKSASNVSRLVIDLPVIGTMTFGSADIDRLYDAIMNS